MTQIITIDGERHNVKETKEIIDNRITLGSNKGFLILKVNKIIIISSWECGVEIQKSRYEPVSFIISNIISYY